EAEAFVVATDDVEHALEGDLLARQQLHDAGRGTGPDQAEKLLCHGHGRDAGFYRAGTALRHRGARRRGTIRSILPSVPDMAWPPFDSPCLTPPPDQAGPLGPCAHCQVRHLAVCSVLSHEEMHALDAEASSQLLGP